jgi:hypothetical protein
MSQHRQGMLGSGLTALGVVLVALAALAPPAGAAYSTKLKRYPYLTDVVQTSAIVNWATDRSSSTAVVKYGRASGGSCTASTQAATRTSISVNSASEYQWKARLSVEPDTEYCYRVYLGGSNVDLLGSDPSPRFLSQMPAGSRTPYKFAVFGDWGTVDSDGQNTSQANLLELIADSGARFAVTTGDNLDRSGSQTHYGDLVYGASKVFAPEFWAVPGRSIPIFPALGNHGFTDTHLINFPQDQAVVSSGGRYRVETRCCLNGTSSQSDPSSWYAFDAGNARIYVLEAAWPDANVGRADIYRNDYEYHWQPSSDQYRWLEADLATHPSQLKFAAFHFPLYSDTTSQKSDTFLQGPAGLEGLLSRYGVDIAFTGHAHVYERNLKLQSHGLVNYVSGGGGSEPSVSIGTCSPFDAYAIGWSSVNNLGSSCGAPKPATRKHVFHFLLVTVDGTSVTVAATDQWGREFEVITYKFPDEAPQAAQTPPGSAATPRSASGSATAPRDRRDPARISGVRVVPKSFRAAPHGPGFVTQSKRRTPFGAQVRFSLDRQARIEFRVMRAMRSQGLRCRRARRSDAAVRWSRRCTRLVPMRGTLELNGSARRNRVHFRGRIGGHRLKPGRYRLVATPTSGRLRGRPASVPFRITR